MSLLKLPWSYYLAVSSVIVMAGEAHAAVTVTVISPPAILDPSTNVPGDKDNCPPTNSNADPEEGVSEVVLNVTSPVLQPTIRLTDNNSPTSALWATDTIDDLTLDEFNATNGAPVANGTRNLDDLDGVIDGQLAPGTYPLYFNLDKTGYNQDTLANCAGNSLKGDHDGYTFAVYEVNTLVASTSGIVAMEASASISQNDLRWLATAPSSVEGEVGDTVCLRTKYSWQSQNSAEQLVAQIYYKADVVRLDHFTFYYYNSNAVDIGSIANGVPGVSAPGPTPSRIYNDDAYITLSEFAGTQSSGDHYVGEYCFKVVGPGSSRFIPYFQSQVNADKGTWKVDTGYPGWLSEPPAVINPPVLEVTKQCSISAASLVAGLPTQLTHTVELCNTGKGNASSVSLVDTIANDPNVSFVSASNGGTYNSSTHQITWSVGTLSAETCTTRTFTISVTPDASDAGSNIATNLQVTATGVSDVKSTYSVTDSDPETCPYAVLAQNRSASLSKTVTGSVDLDGNGVLSPGDIVQYQVSYANTGNVSLSAVSVTDDPDEAYIDSVGDISGGGTYNGDLITWNVGSLAVGATGSFTYSAQLAGVGTFPHGTTTVPNYASLSSSSLSSPVSAQASVQVQAATVLTLAKSVTGYVDVDGDGVLSPGDQVSYRLAWANTGNADATGTVVTDNPDETWISGISSISNGGSYNGDLITWSLGTVSAESSGTLTYTATLQAAGTFPDGSTTVSNTAAIDSSEVSPVTASASVSVSASTELTLAKTVSGYDDEDLDGTLSPGDTVHYQLTWTNVGNAPATGTVVTDDPDETYVASVTGISGSGSYNGDIVTWNVGTVAPGSSGSVTYSAVLAAPGAFADGSTPVVNIATIDSNQTAPVSDSATVTVSASALLTLDKVSSGYTDVDGNGVLSPGDVVLYQVSWANVGNAAANSVVVTDNPDETYVASISAISDGGVYSGGVITWSLGTLEPDSSGALTYSATLKGAGTFASGDTTVSNTASIASDETGSVSDTVTVTVSAATTLTITKVSTGYTDVDGNGVRSPGDVIAWSISYTNTGNATATGVSIEDDPDESYVASIGSISSGGTYDGDVIRWSLGTVASGASGTLTYSATLEPAGVFPGGTTTVANTATIDSDQTDPQTTSATVTVAAAPILIVSKRSSGYTDVDGDGLLSPGDVATYEISFDNVGNAVAHDVSLTDDPSETYLATIAGISGGGTYDGDLITWSIGELDPGDGGTVTYTATLKAPGTFPHGATAVENTVTIDSIETGPSTGSATVTVNAATTLTVTKNSIGYADADANGVLSPGDEVRYSLSYANIGNATATGAVVVDDPDETYVASITEISSGGIYDGDEIAWNLGSLLPGATGTLTYVAVLQAPGLFPNGASTVTNVATIDSNEIDPASATASVTVNAAASVSIAKSTTGYEDVDGNGALSPGDVVGYRVSYANDGNATASGVVVVDDPDETYVASIGSITGGGTYDGDVITWSVGSLTPGASAAFTYSATLKAPGGFADGSTAVSNTASISSNETQPATSTVTVTVVAAANLTLAKASTGYVDADGNGALSPGDSIHYSLAYANSGNAPATNTTVVDDPDETYIASVSSITGGGSYDGNQVTWNLGSVAAGASGTLTYTVTLKAAGAFADGTTSVSNSVVLDSDDTDPVTDTDTQTVTAEANLTLAKASTGYTDADGNGALSPGDSIHYSLAYANSGNAPATNTTVVDDPDETYIASVSSITGGGSYDGNQVTWSLGTVAAGASGTLTYTVTLKAAGAFADGTTSVSNSVVLDSDDTDPVTDTDTQTVTAEANLTVTKASSGYTDADGNGALSPGDSIQYSLAYANSGNAPATNTTLVDDPDETYVASVSSITGGGSYDGNQVTWSLGTVAAGASGTLTYTVTLKSAGAFGDGSTSVSNSVVLDSDDTDPVTDTDTQTVTAEANLTVAKASTGYTDADGNGTLSPGDSIQYSLAYANSGNAPATNTTVVDDPDETYIASVSSITGGGSYDGNQVTWSLGTVAAGASGTLTYTVTLKSAGAFGDGSTSVSNSVVLDSDDTDPVTDTDTQTVTAEANLTVAKASTGYTDADGNGTLSPGDSIQYSLAYANSGNAPATNTTVVDDPDETYIASVSSISGGGSYDGNQVTWSLGTVAAGASGTLTYTVTLKSAGAFGDGSTSVSNSVVLDSDDTDPVTDTDTQTVTAEANLTVAKASTGYTDADSNGALSPGDSIHYSLAYANSGNAPATNTTLVDDPDETYIASVSSITGGGSYDGNQVTWSLGTVAAGASGTLTYTVTLKAAGAFADGTTSVSNSVVLDSDDTDPVTDTDTQTVTAEANLTVTKATTGYTDADSNGALSPGDSIQYSLAYANSGNAPATNTTVVDDPDETYIASVSSITGGGSYDGNQVTWSLGTVAAGASGTLTYTVTLKAAGAFADGTTSVSNSVVLDSDDTDPVTDTDTQTVTAEANLTVAKASTGYTDADGNGTLSPGDSIQYSLAYANSGNAPATNTTVVDDPDETYIASVSSITGGGSYDGNQVTWSLGTVAAGASGTLTYTVTLKAAGAFADGTTSVSNSVVLDSDDTDPVTDTDTQTVTADANLTVAKVSTGYTDLDLDGELSPGDTVDYRVSYANTGNAASHSTVLTDDPDETYVIALASITGDGVYDGDIITWSLGTVAAGASGAFTYTALLGPAGTFPHGSTAVVNIATIVSDETAAVTATATVTVEAAASLTVAKASTGYTDTDGDGTLSPGDSVHYRIVVSNAGNASATGVSVSDDPDERYVASITSISNSGAYDGDQIAWSLGSVASGASVTLTYTAVLEAPGAFADGTTSVGNTATVTSDQLDPITAEATVTVTSEATLAIVKALVNYTDVDADGAIGPGDVLNYALSYSNTGNAAATSVTVTDDPDEAWIAGVSNISSDGSYDGDEIVWSLGTVAAGGSGTLTYSVSLAAAGTFPAGNTAVTNAVVVTSPDADPATDTDTQTVTANPKLAIVKAIVSTTVIEETVSNAASVVSAETSSVTSAAVSAAVAVSTRIEYAVTVDNTGNAAASSVVVSDPLPSGVDFVSADGGGVYNASSRTVTWSVGTMTVGQSASYALVVNTRY